MKTVAIALLGLGLMAPAAGWANQLCIAEEKMSRTLSGGVSAAEVEMFNGSIELRAGTERQAVVEVTKRGSGETPEAARADLKNIEVVIEQTSRGLRVIARRSDRSWAGNSGASAVVSVPAGVNARLKTSNGGIDVAGSAGPVNAESDNGEIKVQKARGRIELVTSNAGITLENGSGTLKLETSNGNIDAAGEGALSATTSNGNITFRGRLTAGDHRLETGNGSVEAVLPADASFTLDAETSNSGVETDFGLPVDPENESELKGSVGSKPAFTLMIRNSNGSIAVRKGGR